MSSADVIWGMSRPSPGGPAAPVAAPPPPAEVLILGVGNLLVGDEGVGVRLMEAVRDARPWPGEVEFIDGGVGGLNLLNIIEEAARLIVFDAADILIDRQPFVYKFGIEGLIVQARSYIT